MNGEFQLQLVDDTTIDLKLTKRVYYNFEKMLGKSFLSPFADFGSDGGVQLKPLEVLNGHLQATLAFLAQTTPPKKRLSIEQLVDKADAGSLSEFLTFAIGDYMDSRGLSPASEGQETIPDPS